MPATASRQSDAGASWLSRGPSDPALRFPLLGDVMAAVALAWTESFSNLAATEGEIAFRGLETVHVADVPRERRSLPVLAAIRVSAWDAVAGLVLDRDGISTILEAFFGGGQDEEEPADDRPLSPIELRLVDVFGGQAASALTTAFRTVLPTRFEFDRTLVKPEPKFLGKATAAMLLARFELTTVRRTLAIDILLPQSAIEARSRVFVEQSATVVPLDTAGWTRQFTTEVSRAGLAIEASVAMHPMTLGALASMSVGQVLELPPGATATVALSSGDETLFRCRLGQSAGFYTVQVEEVLDRDPQSPRKTR